MLQHVDCQPSRNIDSTIAVTLSSIDTTYRPTLDSLYGYLISKKLYDRVDTLKYSRIFIEASCIDTFFNLIEWYFDSGSKYAKRIYSDSKWIENTDVHIYETTLSELNSEFRNLKTVQTLPYKKKQIWYVGSKGRKQFKIENCEQKRKGLLMRTYQIQIQIISESNSVIVSLKTPPVNPKIKIHFEDSEATSEE